MSLQGKKAQLQKDNSGVAFIFFFLPLPHSKTLHCPRFCAFCQDPEEKVPTHDILSQDAVASSGSLLWDGPQCGPQWEVSGDQQNRQHQNVSLIWIPPHLTCIDWNQPVRNLA